MSDTTQAGTQTVEELPNDKQAIGAIRELARIAYRLNDAYENDFVIAHVDEIVNQIRTAERARVEAEYREQLEQAKHEHRRNLADCVQHAECGWQWREKLQRDLNCERDALLCIFSTVIATPERGYTGEPEMLLSDARQVCRELRRAQSELMALRARLPQLVKTVAATQRAECYYAFRESRDGGSDSIIETPLVDPTAIITEWEAQGTKELTPNEQLPPLTRDGQQFGRGFKPIPPELRHKGFDRMDMPDCSPQEPTDAN